MAELNLVPYDLKKRGKFSLGAKEKTIVTFVVIVSFVFAIGLPILRIQLLKARENSLKAEIKRGEAVLKESQKLAGEIQNYRVHIGTVNGIVNNKPTVTEKVKGLEKYIVGDVVFDSLTLGEKVITIRASAKDYNSICVFTANIQEAEEYKGARISNITYNQQQLAYTCSISINY